MPQPWLQDPLPPWQPGIAHDALLRTSIFPATPPPSTSHHAAAPNPDLATALVAAWAAAAEGLVRVREAAIAWEHERDAADACQIADAEHLLGLRASAEVRTTSAGSADPRVSRRGSLARSGRPARDVAPLPGRGCPEHPAPCPGRPRAGSPFYARWRDLVILTLRRYALDDHVLNDVSIAVQTPAWLRLDSIVLSWILGTISLDLHNLICNTPHARGAWLALEGQFLGNADARALRLDASFRTFVQGNLSVSEFCRQIKGMADSLGDLGWPVKDRIFGPQRPLRAQ